MDVIAGRKNQGRITGDIRVNGHPQACTRRWSLPQRARGLSRMSSGVWLNVL